HRKPKMGADGSRDRDRIDFGITKNLFVIRSRRHSGVTAVHCLKASRAQVRNHADACSRAFEKITDQVRSPVAVSNYANLYQDSTSIPSTAFVNLFALQGNIPNRINRPQSDFEAAASVHPR